MKLRENRLKFRETEKVAENGKSYNTATIICPWIGLGSPIEIRKGSKLFQPRIYQKIFYSKIVNLKVKLTIAFASENKTKKRKTPRIPLLNQYNPVPLDKLRLSLQSVAHFCARGPLTRRAMRSLAMFRARSSIAGKDATRSVSTDLCSMQNQKRVPTRSRKIQFLA